jgi:transcription elongation factor GreA
MSNETTYKTTENGLQKLIAELKRREGKIRKKITDAIAEAQSQGDQSENDGYDLALDQQRDNEMRIEELKEKIDNAEVVKNSSKGKINLGSIVTLSGARELTYEITGEEEANPLEGKISHKSPIGKAVLGKKVGDKIKIKTPQGELEYKVSNIE